MFVPLTAVLVAFFYLNAIPLQLVVCLELGNGAGFGLGISIFEPRFAHKKALLRCKGEIKPLALGKSGGINLNKLRNAFPAVMDALKQLSPEKIALNGSFSTGDAAVTALLSGGVSALGYAIGAVTGSETVIDFRPDFSSQNLSIRLSGMISVRVGHIMLAALHGALKYGNGRFTQWISIRSKAS